MKFSDLNLSDWIIAVFFLVFVPMFCILFLVGIIYLFFKQGA